MGPQFWKLKKMNRDHRTTKKETEIETGENLNQWMKN